MTNIKTNIIKGIATASVIASGAIPALQAIQADTTTDLNAAKDKLTQSEATLNEKKAVYDNLAKLQGDAETELSTAMTTLEEKQ